MVDDYDSVMAPHQKSNTEPRPNYAQQFGRPASGAAATPQAIPAGGFLPGQPASPAAQVVPGAAPPPATTPTPPSDPAALAASKAARDAALDLRKNIMPHITAPGGEAAKSPTFGYSEDAMNHVADAMAGANVNPAAMKSFAEDVRSGVYGDPTKFTDALARSAATNYFHAQRPDFSMQSGVLGQSGHDVPISYTVPGLFKARKGDRSGVALGAQNVAQAAAGGIPWNEIVLPNGRVVKVSPTDFYKAAGVVSGSLATRRAHAPRRGEVLGRALEELAGVR